MLHIKTKTIFSASIILSASGLLSRALGLIRDNLLANSFPKGQTDIYFASFKVPDFLYSVLVMGGIMAVFIPVFSGVYKENKEEARELISSALFIVLASISLLSAILFALTPKIVDLIAPGFNSFQKVQTILLTRIMFLSPVFLGLSAVISSVLQYFNFFLAYALAPIFYNLGIILGIVFFAPIFGLKGLAFGVVFGAACHLLIQLPPFIKLRLISVKKIRIKAIGIGKMVKLMIPRTIGSIAYQINLIVLMAIASVLSEGAISVFNFANNLQFLPIGLIGIPLAQAIFPSLSRDYVNNESQEFDRKFQKAVFSIIFLALPAGLLIFVLKEQIVSLVLGFSLAAKSFFNYSQIKLTAASLGAFSLSIFASASVPFLAKSFFSTHDTKTPVKIAIFSVSLNIGLAYLFVWLINTSALFSKAISYLFSIERNINFSIVALPLSVSISIITQFFLLLLFFKKKRIVSFSKILLPIKKIIIASFVSSIMSAIVLKIEVSFFGRGLAANLILFFNISILFAAFYLFLLRLFNLSELGYLFNIIEKNKILGKIWKTRGEKKIK